MSRSTKIILFIINKKDEEVKNSYKWMWKNR